MKLLFLAATCLCLAIPSRAWRIFGEPSDGKIRPVQKLNDENKPGDVLTALTPQFMQTLRGTDLRQAYVLLGDSLQKLGRSDEALGYYQLGVSLFPKNVDLLVRQAMLLHREGLDERAKPLFERALTYEPRHWNAHQGLAEIDRTMGFFERSAQHFEIALESVDKRPEIWRDYAEVLLSLRDYRTAELALKRALELEPRNVESVILLGFAKRAQNDLPGASRELETALDLGAGIGARRALGLFRLEAGDYAQARIQADLVLKEVPNDGAALWIMARVRLAAGDEAGALSRLAAASTNPASTALSARIARVLAARLRENAAQREESLYQR
jgi:tetratricopeptide (TPR) repeat protein